MKCPSCNKFASLDMQDPEVISLEIDEAGHITAEVRIVRNSACCGDEMKEAALNMEADLDEAIVEAHKGDTCELEVEEDGVEPIEEGGGRYAKSFFGATLNCSVRCACQEPGTDALAEIELTDKVAASAMEELA